MSDQMVMGSASGSVDVIDPELFEALLEMRARLRSALGVDELEALDVDLLRLEARAPRLLEVLLLRCLVARRLYSATHELDHLDRAFGVATRARALDPRSPSPLLAELEVALAYGQLERCRQLFDEIERLAPGRLGVSAWRAWYLRLAGEREEARKILRRQLRDHSSPESHYELAHLELEIGDYASAIRHLELALALAPGNPPTTALLAQAELLGGDLEHAAELYRGLLDERRDVASLSNLGLVELLLGQPARALPHFAAAVELAPSNAVLQLNLADALQALGDGQTAREHYRRVLELSSVAADWQTFTVRAQALARLGRAEESLDALDRGRALSERPEIRLEAAIVLALVGQYSAAAGELYEAICRQSVSPVWLRLPVFDGLRAATEPAVEVAAGEGSRSGNSAAEPRSGRPDIAGSTPCPRLLSAWSL